MPQYVNNPLVHSSVESAILDFLLKRADDGNGWTAVGEIQEFLNFKAGFSFSIRVVRGRLSNLVQAEMVCVNGELWNTKYKATMMGMLHAYTSKTAMVRTP